MSEHAATMGILGAGFSGSQIAQRALAGGYAAWGTSRSVEKLKPLERQGLSPVEFDGATITDGLRAKLAHTTHLIVSIAPPREEGETGRAVDPFLRALSGAGFDALMAAAPKLRFVCYLSTVGVYGNYDGAWIDEEADCRPSSARSRQRLRAEDEWLQACKAAALPLAIFRLSGIYGPGRNALLSAENGKARRLIKEGQVFNRIHVEDIASATLKAAQLCRGGVFNITDDEPAPPQDVVLYAHDLLGLTPPPEIAFETAELSPMARSFYGENKRVSNQKSKTEMGLHYDYPNYRAALTRMHRAQTWRAGDA
ncbi:MAG: SDR family oxidoreductase [Pseudomonadota bacterium]